MKMKQLFNIILNATALAIVAGLIANAVLSVVFKYLGNLFLPDFFQMLSRSMYLMQFAIPVLVGISIGNQLKLNTMQTMVIGIAVLGGSGSLTFDSELGKWTAIPMGDLFNVIFAAFISTIFVMYLGDKFGSLTTILLPMFGAGIPICISLYTLPYAKSITKYLADILFHFTTLHPQIMCVLIAISFSLLIVSPVSTVAMGIILFTNTNQLGAGAAALGVLSAAYVLAIGSIKAKNPKGVTYAIILGAIKLMMPNCARTPLLMIPIFLTAAVTGFSGYIFNILGTQESAGFGIIGLLGPVKALELNVPFINVILSFFIIPIISAFIFDKICQDYLKLYTKDAYISNNY